MTNIFLLASDSDPVGNAVDSQLSSVGGYRRISIDEFSSITPANDDVLILGESSAESLDSRDLPGFGMVQYVGCRPPTTLLEHSTNPDVIVAGISPVIAPRVANRVIGFTGPLTVKPKPNWGIIGLGEIGSEVVRKVTANRVSAVIADTRTPRTGMLDDLNVRRQTLDLLVAGSDAISIHVQPGPTAAPLISERELNLMHSDAVLINTSDSTVVDETSIIAALTSGQLTGYATDCPGSTISTAPESLIVSGKLIVTTNPLTNQIGAAQQIARYIQENVEAFTAGTNVRGKYETIDYPVIGDPSFWSSRMSPRQD